VLKAKGADISASGRDFIGAFKGDATLAETPVFDGKVELDAKNVAALAKDLGQEVKGLSLLDAVKFSADLAGQAKGFKAENVNANISGERIFQASALTGHSLAPLIMTMSLVRMVIFPPLHPQSQTSSRR